MNKRLGCFSTSAIMAGVITALVIASFAILNSNALFSPGELNTMTGDQKGGVSNHAQITDCASCHPGMNPADHMADRCLTCHTEITAEENDPASLHGVLMENNSELDCRQCHTEHNGPAAKLTIFENPFPHEKLGFSLAAHPDQTCTDCHSGSYRNFDTASCTDCHKTLDAAFTTAHILSFGTDCVSCHDGLDSRGANFDHAQTSFPLIGLHSNLLCTKCHTNARTLADMQNAPVECAGCHLKDDAHDGRFGKECESCHTADGWTPAKFDHNLASFKLIGKHIDVICEKCHVDKKFKGIASTCASCHLKDDAHDGSLGTDCSICHTTDGWTPSSYDHNLSAFKLTGAHTNAECSKCHADKKFKGTPSQCGSCHSEDDDHNGQLGMDCSPCHSTTAWKPSTFNHNNASFKLTGAHTNAKCSACHQNGNFKGAPSQCGSCHGSDDKHNGQFGSNCGACHSTSAWKPATFDHNLSNFKLTGAHNNAACSACHQNGNFKGTPTQCGSCHGSDDKHNGQFGSNCGACHSTSAWKPASFDHNLSGFSLTGAHAGAACSACHGSGNFSGLSSACVSCHADPAYHSGMFGTDCGSCHSTSNWNASYNGPHPMIDDKNGMNHEGASCADCHTSTLHDATCTKCHDSNNPGDGD